MTSLAPGYPVDSMYYLSRAEVIKACTGIDVLVVVADALRQHAAGTTILPAEAYLGWQASNGTPARSLAMPVGCGTLARAHLELLLRVLPQLEQISVCDISPQRRKQLAGEVRSRHPSGHPAITQADTPRDCVRVPA